MKKQKLKSYIHNFSRIIGVISLLLIARDVYKSFTYSELYDKAPAEIAAQSEDGFTWGFTVERQDHEVTASLWALNGCETIDSVKLSEETKICITGMERKGNAKVMLLNENHDIAAFETVSEQQEEFVIKPGKYQIIAVGTWYSGKIMLKY